MRLFYKFNKWLDDHYSSDDREDIIELEVDNSALHIEMHNLRADIDDMESALKSQQETIKELEETIKTNNKHSSLTTFKQWLEDNVPQAAIKYDFGKGEQLCRESLWPRTKSLHLDFIKKVLKINIYTIKDLDDTVYKINTVFDKKYPQPYWYETEYESHGVIDLWENPDQTIDRLIKRKKGDCDMFGSGKYGLIKAVLDELYPSEAWRLRVFIVRTISGETHYMLGWVKKAVNDWIPIETTWYNKSFQRAWTENLTLRNNSAYRIMWSFDETTEYERNTL